MRAQGKSKPHLVSVVVPLYNEGEGISILVETLSYYANSGLPFDVEFIFVDDGSTDDSWNKLRQQDYNFDATLLKLAKNTGSHIAVRAGFMQARGDYIVFLTADLQYSPELLTKLYAQIVKGFNIVRAERNVQSYASILTKTTSRLYASLMRRFAIANYPKKGFDIIMFDRKVLKEMNDNIETNSSVLLQLISLGYAQDAVKIDVDERKFGSSKWTFSRKLKLSIDSFVAFSYFPIRMVSILGALFFLLGLIGSAYLVIYELIIGGLELGWPSIMCLLLMGFGITNISLGILAEYLWRVLDSVNGRKPFVVDETLRFGEFESRNK